MKRIISIVAAVVLLATVASGQDALPATPSLLKTSFGKLPIYFIENRGVYPEEVLYYAQGADKTLFFTKEGITFRLEVKDRGWVVKLEFVGANPDVLPRGEDRQQAVFSYFKGPEKDWKTGLPTYSRIVYEDLWPGIDLVYRGTVTRLKYEFVVKPGADPDQIRSRYRGATAVEVGESKGLRIETPAGRITDAPPLAWQEIGGERVPVEMAYLPAGNGMEEHAFGFQVGKYDRTIPLILDPAILVYCGYLGGGSGDTGYGIAVDAAGNAYVTGDTRSCQPAFPVKVGPDLSCNGIKDAFVAKVNAQGTGLVYCGYIGGASWDGGAGIAVDAAGSAYVAGWTDSDQKTFPVTVGPDLDYNGGLYDAFVAKVNPLGTGLDYCGYIGGADYDWGYGIAVDAAGNAFVTGYTHCDQKTFPVRVGPDLTHNGIRDVFVAKVNAQGTGLVYCGYIGGAADDYGKGIAVDRAGNAFVTGHTRCDQKSFPVRVGPDLTYNGPDDAFVAKVNAQGTGLVYCGYIGGAASDRGNGIAVDASGNAYVTGYTYSDQQTFPVKAGPDLTCNGNEDAFIAKVNAQGTGLLFCGYIGGKGHDAGHGIAVGAMGNAYVTGYAESDQQTFPVTGGPDLSHNGIRDAFVANVNAQGTGLVHCGYIGGASWDGTRSIAVDPAGNAYMTGDTESDHQTFPVKTGPDLTFNGRFFNAFVAKVSLTLLTGSGTTYPGGIVNLALAASDDAGLSYQAGTSLGTGPIPIDTRKLGLSPDDLLQVSVAGLWPSTFRGYRGLIDNQGQARASIHVPNDPVLIGLRLYTAFVTLDPAAPSGIKSISSTFSFSITK